MFNRSEFLKVPAPVLKAELTAERRVTFTPTYNIPPCTSCKDEIKMILNKMKSNTDETRQENKGKINLTYQHVDISVFSFFCQS